MKKLLTILLLPFLSFLASCSNDDGLADAYGNFEATQTIISAQAEGKLLVFNVDEGQSLEKDAVVGQVDTTQLHLQKMHLLQKKKTIAANYSGVFASVNVLRQKVDNSMIEKRRIENLLKSDATPERNLDDINSYINVLEKEISATKTQNQTIFQEMQTVDVQVLQIEEMISKSQVINPVDGTVLVKFAEAQEVTGFGRPLYKIADLDTMILRVYISGAQLPSVKLGQKVKVFIDKDADSDRELEGVITWIASQAEFTPKIIQTKDERVGLVYAVKVQVINDGTLKIGMPGAITFNLDSDLKTP